MCSNFPENFIFCLLFPLPLHTTSIGRRGDKGCSWLNRHLMTLQTSRMSKFKNQREGQKCNHIHITSFRNKTIIGFQCYFITTKNIMPKGHLAFSFLLSAPLFKRRTTSNFNLLVFSKRNIDQLHVHSECNSFCGWVQEDSEGSGGEAL